MRVKRLYNLFFLSKYTYARAHPPLFTTMFFSTMCVCGSLTLFIRTFNVKWLLPLCRFCTCTFEVTSVAFFQVSFYSVRVLILCTLDHHISCLKKFQQLINNVFLSFYHDSHSLFCISAISLPSFSFLFPFKSLSIN